MYRISDLYRFLVSKEVQYKPTNIPTTEPMNIYGSK